MAKLAPSGADLPDHRRLCVVEVRVNYSHSNPNSVRHDDKTLRRDWHSSRMTIPMRAPTNQTEMLALWRLIGNHGLREMLQSPPLSVRR